MDQIEHVQPSLLPPEVVEITVRVGLVGSVGHGQWQVEARSATDDVLLAMTSRPHFDVEHLDHEVEQALLSLRRMATSYLLPF